MPTGSGIGALGAGCRELLDQFILHHVQLSLLQAKLIATPKTEGSREAKVELKLAPRLVKTDSGEELPSYQVSARLSCRAGSKEDAGPHFDARVGIEAIYRQIDGDPLDSSEVSAHHASLTRQLYPMMQQELRTLLIRLGLEQVQLPYDLPAKVEFKEDQTVKVQGSVH